MVRSNFSLLVALAVAAFLAGSPVRGQERNAETERELAEFRENLLALEAEFGYSHPALLESLSGVADRLRELGDYAGAHAALDRAQQIVRYNEGLYSLNQLPILHKKIENLGADGNWADARPLQDHLLWFYTEHYPRLDGELIDGLLRGAESHLQGVRDDSPEYASYHYRNAAMHSRLALLVAEEIWAPGDRRLAPIYYDQLRQAYLQALAIRKGGAASSGLRSRPRADGYDSSSGFRLDRDVAVSMQRAGGYRYLAKLRELFSHPRAPDPEAVAMVTLYEADWQVLFRQYELALTTYGRARSELLAAGVAAENVEALLATPVLIPEPRFHDSVAAALASRGDETALVPGPPQTQPIRLSFNLPQPPTLVALPEIVNGLGLAGEDAALFAFRLPGVDGMERSFWSRQGRALGEAQNIRLLDSGLPDYVERETLVENLGWLRFRPSLVNGAPRAVSGILGYMLFAVD